MLKSIPVLASCRRRSFEPSKDPKIAGCVGGLTLNRRAMAGKMTTRVGTSCAALEPIEYQKLSDK
jgi:hypothetical protein